jgi:hypothetical protein
MAWMESIMNILEGSRLRVDECDSTLQGIHEEDLRLRMGQALHLLQVDRVRILQTK